MAWGCSSSRSTSSSSRFEMVLRLTVSRMGNQPVAVGTMVVEVEEVVLVSVAVAVMVEVMVFVATS